MTRFLFCSINFPLAPTLPFPCARARYNKYKLVWCASYSRSSSRCSGSLTYFLLSPHSSLLSTIQPFTPVPHSPLSTPPALSPLSTPPALSPLSTPPAHSPQFSPSPLFSPLHTSSPLTPLHTPACTPPSPHPRFRPLRRKARRLLNSVCLLFLLML